MRVTSRTRLDTNFVPFVSERDGLQRLKNSNSKYRDLVINNAGLNAVSSDSLPPYDKAQSIVEQSKLKCTNEDMYRRKLKSLVGSNLSRQINKQPKLTIARDMGLQLAFRPDNGSLVSMLDQMAIQSNHLKLNDHTLANKLLTKN